MISELNRNYLHFQVYLLNTYLEFQGQWLPCKAGIYRSI